MRILNAPNLELFQEATVVDVAVDATKVEQTVIAVAQKYEHIEFTPPQGVQTQAQKGLDYREKFGRGGTAVGVARARDLSNGKNLSPQTLRRMKSYFARHAVDSQGANWANASDPSAGYVAWLLWGGDAGKSWCEKVCNQMDSADGKETSSTPAVRVLASKRIPAIGDKFILGLMQYPVVGYVSASKRVTASPASPALLLYAKTYADRKDPHEIAVSDLKPLDDVGNPCWWIEKHRVSGKRVDATGNKPERAKNILFDCSVPGAARRLDPVSVWAVSLADARNKALSGFGHALGFSTRTTDNSVRVAALSKTKTAICELANVSEFNMQLITAIPALKN